MNSNKTVRSSEKHFSDDFRLEEQTRFVWDGSHLLQEVHPDGRYTYLYTDQDPYEPLAQVHNWTNEEGESKQEIHYFHCDQIGIPRALPKVRPSMPIKAMTVRKIGNI
ncbi:hypothetical protein [Neisseria sp. Marseille-Q1983]|uniref:hypothetical protein n=1 Tax=Neisseria sp. Marseille-Q1983 TaxID=2830768 RepID=UPI0020122300